MEPGEGMAYSAHAASIFLTPYRGYQVPAESIGHAAWLSVRFALRYSAVEALLAARGVVVTYEPVRQWDLQCGQQYANQLRRRRAQPGATWPLDAVLLMING